MSDSLDYAAKQTLLHIHFIISLLCFWLHDIISSSMADVGKTTHVLFSCKSLLVCSYEKMLFSLVCLLFPIAQTYGVQLKELQGQKGIELASTSRLLFI